MRLQVLAVLLGALAVTSVARGATEECPFGVNAHQASNAALDKVAAAGIGWVRFDMNWLQFEPSKGNYNWKEADRFIDHAHGLGLHTFVTVAYSPSWAVQQPCNDADANPVNICRNRPPLKGSDWTDFVTAAVNRYKAKVTHWGMWNEPNLIQFFNGTRPQYVDLLLKPGSDAVHAACPNCKVLGPELANLRGANWDSKNGTCIGNECIFNGWNYSLPKVLEAAGSYIDIVTHHKYKDPALTLWQQLVDGETQVIKVINGLKEITDQYTPGKDVWLTEFGWEAEPYGKHSNAYAATQLTEFYQGLDAIHKGSVPGAINQPWPQLKKLFWYDLHDDPNGYSWGLMEADLKTKPQYDAYKAVIQMLGPCDGGSGGSGGSGSSTSSSSTGSSSTSSSGGASSSGSAGAGGAASSSGSGAKTSSGSSSGSSGGGDTDADSGCSCRIAGRPSMGWLAWLALLPVWLRRRRR